MQHVVLHYKINHTIDLDHYSSEPYLDWQLYKIFKDHLASAELVNVQKFREHDKPPADIELADENDPFLYVELSTKITHDLFNNWPGNATAINEFIVDHLSQDHIRSEFFHILGQNQFFRVHLQINESETSGTSTRLGEVEIEGYFDSYIVGLPAIALESKPAATPDFLKECIQAITSEDRQVYMNIDMNHRFYEGIANAKPYFSVQLNFHVDDDLHTMEGDMATPETLQEYFESHKSEIKGIRYEISDDDVICIVDIVDISAVETATSK